MKKARAKAGSWSVYSASTASVDVRSVLIDDTGKRWRWVVDNNMRNFGEVNYQRRIVRINHARHKEGGESLIDTLFHEELHRLFPTLSERAVCSMTTTLLPTLSARYRSWLYARIRRR